MEQKGTKGFKYRGLAVIIVNQNFKDDAQAKRRGAKKDLRKMKSLFAMLDFEVKAYANKTSGEMLNILDKARTRKYDYVPECFVCVVSSHGFELEVKKGKKCRGTETQWKPSVIGTDGLAIYADDIINKFTDSNCEAYKGKPKLFFVQACRVRETGTMKDCYDEGIEIEVLIKEIMKLGVNKKPGRSGDNRDASGCQDGQQAGIQLQGDIGKLDADILDLTKKYQNEALSEDEWDGQESAEEEELEEEAKDEKDSGHKHDSKAPVEESDLKTAHEGAGSSNMILVPNQTALIDIPKDCLLMVPVMSGKYAFRNSVLGSWMLHFMYKNKAMLLDGATMLQYLTKVCGDIAEYEFNPNPPPDDMPKKVIEMLPCKMCACITHRLTDDPNFEPLGDKSFMHVIKEKLFSMLKK